MVQVGKTKEVDGNSAKPRRQSKKSKKVTASTFYTEGLDSLVDSPQGADVAGGSASLEATKHQQKNLTSGENDGNTCPESEPGESEGDGMEEASYEVVTRKSESHWYMIYYDESFNISSDNEDSDKHLDDHKTDQLYSNNKADNYKVNENKDEVDNSSVAKARPPFVFTIPVLKERERKDMERTDEEEDKEATDDEDIGAKKKAFYELLEVGNTFPNLGCCYLISSPTQKLSAEIFK